jgi:hypothetical protein
MAGTEDAYVYAPHRVSVIQPGGEIMGTLLEVGRHLLEGVEVLTAFGTTALLAMGLHYSRHAHGDDPTHAPAPESKR